MTLDLLAVVPSHGAVRVVIVDELGQAVGTSLDLADTACRDAIGMYVSVNLVERTARCQPGVGTDTPAQVELAERARRFDDSVAVPDYADGPPSQE